MSGQSGPRLWLHPELGASWRCPSILSTRSRRRASAFTSTLTNLHRVLRLTRDKDTPSHCPAHSTQHRQQVRVLQRGGLAQGAEAGEQPGRPWAWRSGGKDRRQPRATGQAQPSEPQGSAWKPREAARRAGHSLWDTRAHREAGTRARDRTQKVYSQGGTNATFPRRGRCRHCGEWPQEPAHRSEGGSDRTLGERRPTALHTVNTPQTWRPGHPR